MIAAGGYAHDTVGEDMELVVNLRRRAAVSGGPGRIVFVPDPVAWTEVPESLRVLGRQRDRWQRGLADVLWRHRALIGNVRHRALGLVVMPYFVIVELLGPIVEVLGLIGLVAALALGAVDVPFALFFFAAAYGFGLLLTMFTLVLEEVGARRYEGWMDRLLMLVWAAAESLGYRQLTVLWRVRGLVNYARGRREWGVMTRRGFAGSAAQRHEAGAAGGRTAQKIP